MAKDVKRVLSLSEQREVMRWETWLTATSGFRCEYGSRQIPLPTVSIFGGPKLKPDIVLVVGDSLRAAAEAAAFLRHYQRMEEAYPEVVCMPGFTTAPIIDLGYSAEWWLKVILMRLGIPKKVLKRHPKPVFDRRDPCETLEDMLAEKPDIRTAVVFSSRGYSMAVAQELYQRIPQVRWVFYDNPVVQVEERIFDAENVFSGGIAVDIMIGSIIHARQDWDIVRYKLSSESRYTAPKKLHLRNLVEKGYVLGLENDRDWEYLGLYAEDYADLIAERKAECLSSDDVCRRIRYQVDKLVRQYVDAV